MIVGRISPGEEVKATVYRDGRKKSIRVTRRTRRT
jgi:S1-C subfamily serine protease